MMQCVASALPGAPELQTACPNFYLRHLALALFEENSLAGVYALVGPLESMWER